MGGVGDSWWPIVCTVRRKEKRAAGLYCRLYYNTRVSGWIRQWISQIGKSAVNSVVSLSAAAGDHTANPKP